MMVVGLLRTFILSTVVFIVSADFDLSTQHNCVNQDGRNGRCKPEASCGSFRQVNFQRDLCGFTTMREPITCCDDVNEILSSQLETVYFPGKRLSNLICEEFSFNRDKARKLNRENGVRVFCGEIGCFSQSFVLGGVDAERDEFPHMALIGWEKVSEGYSWSCGGNLISDRFVLTAAHCLYHEDPELKSPEPSAIQVGDQLKSILKIDSLIPHPNYRPPRPYNDIGLIRLEENLRFTETVRPACLWTKSTLAYNVTTIGMGLQSNGMPAERLQKVDINTFTTEQCNRGFPRSRILTDGINHDIQFCAGSSEPGKDSCQGDSGGPIQVLDDKEYRLYHILGITSFGNSCGRGGVYTKIYNYLDWIESNVWPDQLKEFNKIMQRF